MIRLILPLFILIFLTSISEYSQAVSYYSSLYIELDRDKYYEVLLGDDEKNGYGNVEFRYITTGKHRLKIYEYKDKYNNPYPSRKLIYNSTIRFEEGCKVYAYMDSRNELYFEHRDCDNKHYKKNKHKNYLSNREFEEALGVIKNQSFESGRISVSKQVISDYDISVEQLVDILNQMWFESSKLELAKYGYDNMDNVRGFYKVYNVFSFSSSVDELTEYVKSNRKYSSDW